MAKAQDDLLEMKPAATSVMVERSPSSKVALLLRYRTGAKDAAIQEAFEAFGDGFGIELVIPALGLSRRIAKPELFPKGNQYAPGHEAEGYMFVKWQLVS
jgi:hypothetical protein